MRGVRLLVGDPVPSEDIRFEIGLIALDSGLSAMRKGIETCQQAKILLSTLVLTYSGIDTMASLDRPSSQQYVQRNDFMAWVNAYLLPDSALSVTALDLYAARCSILHTFGPRSKLTDDAKASTISYAWGNASAQALREELDHHRRESTEVVHLDTLIGALFTGIDRWKADVADSPDRVASLMLRTDELYFPLSATFLSDVQRKRRDRGSGA
jgi:hypothetical protein